MMTRVGWLMDVAAYKGGAELTQEEFRRAAPDDVRIVACPPGGIDPDCDRYVVHNCVTYTVDDLARLDGRPVVKYWNDVGPWLSLGVREALETVTTTPVCCSHLQLRFMRDNLGFVLDGAVAIPPPLEVQRFEAAAAIVNGYRAGNVSVGSWRNIGKAPHLVAAWAAGNGGVDFFGDGEFAPDGSRAVAHDDMPRLLASYQRFVFLPMVIEPFGRLVMEAYAAGCEIVTNDLVGAKEWIEADPALDAVRTAAGDFWRTVLA